MIDLSNLKTNGKAIAVMGLEKSGLATVAACVSAGIEVVAWDDKPEPREKAQSMGAKIEDLALADFSGFYALALSPGVPLTHPVPARAAAASVQILGDMELLYLSHPAMKSIGITGTNGKSTTTALIGHILQMAGMHAQVGGNIGTAVLALDETKGGIYVLEMSSYQLDLCPTFHPDLAVLINISPDHLDRHGDMEGYVKAKEQIFKGEGVAIIGIDDDWCRSLATRIPPERHIITISAHDAKAAIYANGEGELIAFGKTITDLKKLKTLQGRHNWQNVACAFAVCKSCGLDDGTIVRGLETFPGLAHRQKIARVIGAVTYINDSKATNDQAAAVALATFNAIYWIAGGKPKDGGYKDCERELGHVRHTFLIGEAEDEMARWLEGQGAPHTRCGTLAVALEKAHELAQREHPEGAVVLLSPACASFDQFKNFEQRGEIFENMVMQIT